MKKRSGTVSDSPKVERAKSVAERRREYRKSYHEKNKERENAYNIQRYHEVYKKDPALMKKRRASCKRYASKQGPDWQRERSQRYRKPYSTLSESRRSKIREGYKKWAKKNWEQRVEYARKHRRKKPGFGLRGKIANARRSGDVRKLAQECLDAIVRAYGQGNK